MANDALQYVLPSLLPLNGVSDKSIIKIYPNPTSDISKISLGNYFFKLNEDLTHNNGKTSVRSLFKTSLQILNMTMKKKEF